MAKHCTQCGEPQQDKARFCPTCGAAVQVGTSDPLLGSVIAQRYLLKEKVGQGRSGTIYRGEHTTLGKKVAVKILHQQLSRDDDAIERFRREATTVGEIDNDHILQVLDFGRTEDKRLFFAMELLEGEPLSRVVEREGALPITRAIDVLVQLGEALTEAHRLGYVHRDLRPRNVFLITKRGRKDFVKLLDFGLAKLILPDTAANQTALGMTFGDPSYMAPEQARGEGFDLRADLYSLGVIGYEMVVGRPPYVGSGVFEILQQHLDAPVPQVKTRRPDCPDWLELVLQRLLAKSPDRRFADVQQLVDCLQNSKVPPGDTAAAVAAHAALDQKSTTTSKSSPATPVVKEAAPAAKPEFDAGPTVNSPPPWAAKKSNPKETQAISSGAVFAHLAAAADKLAKPEVAAAPAAKPAPAASSQPEPPPPVAAAPPAASAATQASALDANWVETTDAQGNPNVLGASGSVQVPNAAPPEMPDGVPSVVVAAPTGKTVPERLPPTDFQGEQTMKDDRSHRSAEGAPRGEERRSRHRDRDRPDAASQRGKRRNRSGEQPPTGDEFAPSPSGEWFDDDLDRIQRAPGVARGLDEEYEDLPQRNKTPIIVGSVVGVMLMMILAIALWPRPPHKPLRGEEALNRPAPSAAPSASVAVAPPAPSSAVGEPSPSVAAAPPSPSLAATPPAPSSAAAPPSPPIAAAKPSPSAAAPKPSPSLAAAKPSPSAAAPKPSPSVAAAKPAPKPPRPVAVVEPKPTRAPAVKPEPEPKTVRVGKHLPDGFKDPFAAKPASESAQAEFFIKLGHQKFNSGDMTSAAANFNKAREYDPKSADAIAGLGEVAFEQGDYNGAVVHLKQALRIAPNRTRFFVLLGDSYYKLGKPKDAVGEFRKALKLEPNNQHAQKSLEAAERKISQGG